MGMASGVAIAERRWLAYGNAWSTEKESREGEGRRGGEQEAQDGLPIMSRET